MTDLAELAPQTPAGSVVPETSAAAASDSPPPATTPASWTAVCRLADLAPERGAAALVAGEQVALFRLVDGTVHAVQQLDPFSGAHVISRGIVGTRGDVPTVASPMYKQVFDLRDGRCLDGVGREPRDLRTWAVRLDGDLVLIGAPRDAGEPGERPAGASLDGGAR